jgi:BirA family transcriptional regulator, biotin operon repressor / biotin---[acetyl-CoA-carboxylase] ligase
MNQGDFQLLDFLLGSAEKGSDVGILLYDYFTDLRSVEVCVHRLREAGCEIEQVTPTRWRLVRTSLQVWQDFLTFYLSRAGQPRRVLVFRQTSSTQDVLRRVADPKVVALADEQTAGRGRHGRIWEAPPGASLLMSIGLELESEQEQLDVIQCITAVAVAQTLEKLSGRKLIQIKWPNDLIVDGRKLAGILVETFTGQQRRIAVIGVGVNVELNEAQTAAMPAELLSRSTTLRAIGCPHDRLLVAAELIVKIVEHLRSPHRSLLIDEWRARSMMMGKRATFLSEGHRITGEVLDMDAQAGLIVRSDSGELVHLRSATTTIV